LKAARVPSAQLSGTSFSVWQSQSSCCHRRNVGHAQMISGETRRVFFRHESDLDLGDGALMQSLLEAKPFREIDSHKE
jgi:hypothetical protein